MKISPENREREGESFDGPKASEELFSHVYAELKQLAGAKLSREYGAHSINATVLVHDAYLRMAKGEQHWNDRRHFFAAAAESMRRILIDRARARKRIKRGGGTAPEELRESVIAAPLPDEELLAVHEALEKLEQVDPESAELVKLRFFVGMTQEEIATLNGISARTVKRQWSYARAWLRTAMSDFSPGET